MRFNRYGRCTKKGSRLRYTIHVRGTSSADPDVTLSVYSPSNTGGCRTHTDSAAQFGCVIKMTLPATRGRVRLVLATADGARIARIWVKLRSGASTRLVEPNHDRARGSRNPHI